MHETRKKSSHQTHPRSNFRKRIPSSTGERESVEISDRSREVEFFRAHERPALVHGRKTVRSMRLVGPLATKAKHTNSPTQSLTLLQHPRQTKASVHACNEIT
jgi:hypothetical protein